MLMTKGFDSKILYSLLIVSGFVLTIGAASAVVMYSENIELDNGAGDSSIKITSSTGDSKLILEDQGVHTWSIKTNDGTNRLLITDETLGKTRFAIKKGGQVGIGIEQPWSKLHVNGNLRAVNAMFSGNLDVRGDITGSYIANLEATIVSLEARIAALEASMAINEPMIVTNEAMIATHDTTLTSHDAMILANEATLTSHDTMILSNQADIATNAAAIETGGGGPNPCDPDGDAAITAQELNDVLADHGLIFSLSQVQQWVDEAEDNTPTSNQNGVLDTVAEVAKWNNDRFAPAGIPVCIYP